MSATGTRSRWCGRTASPGALALAYPVTVDGLIYCASMVLLNAARQGVRPHWLAYVALGLGIAATLAANVGPGSPSARSVRWWRPGQRPRW